MWTDKKWIIVWYTPIGKEIEHIGVMAAREREFERYTLASRKSWDMPRAEFYDVDEPNDPELDAQYEAVRREVYAYARKLAQENNVPFDDDEDPDVQSARFLD